MKLDNKIFALNGIFFYMNKSHFIMCATIQFTFLRAKTTLPVD